jgi:hypothetical protein
MPRFSASLDGLAGVLGVVEQVRAVEWALARGMAIENFPAFPTRDGRSIHLYKTLGLAMQPGIVILIEKAVDGKILLHDVRLATANSTPD